MSRPARARVILLADRRPASAATGWKETPTGAVATALRTLDEKGPQAAARLLARAPNQTRVLAELAVVSPTFVAAWPEIRSAMGYPGNRGRSR